MLKPMLARGELQTIGATTLDEYRKHIEKDAAWSAASSRFRLMSPPRSSAVQILKGVRDKYEAHHRVTISDEAIETAVNLAARYISDRFLPDKAVDLIDEAGARLRIKRMPPRPEIKVLEEKAGKLKRAKEDAIRGAGLRESCRSARRGTEGSSGERPEREGMA